MRLHRLGVTCGLLAAMSAGCERATVAADAKDSRSTVTMSGAGTVRRPPDVATLELRVESRANKPAEAQQRASRVAAALMTRLHDLRIPDQSIQTVSYALGRDYDYVKGQQVFRGWTANHVLDVRIEDIPRLGEIIDRIDAAGPIAIDGPYFGLRSSATAYAEALTQAVADARAKAEAAAQGTGARVVRVVSVEEQTSTAPQPRVFEGLSARQAPAAPQTQVSPGELTIEARVTLTLEIR